MVPVKVINFLWRVALGILPTREKLHVRITSISSQCLSCTSDETVLHLFRDCDRA